MAVQNITNTPLNLTGNFDVAVSGSPTNPIQTVQLQKSLGPSTTEWKTIKNYGPETSEIVVNVGQNSFRLLENVPGVTVKCNQP